MRMECLLQARRIFFLLMIFYLNAAGLCSVEGKLTCIGTWRPLFLFCLRINLLVFFHECRSLSGLVSNCLFCCEWLSSVLVKKLAPASLRFQKYL